MIHRTQDTFSLSQFTSSRAQTEPGSGFCGDLEALETI